MNKSNRLIFVLALVLIGGTALGMSYVKANQKLGKPGVKATAIPDSPRLNVYLPPYVLDYDSVDVPTDTNVFNGLPPDTSFAARTYNAPDKTWITMRVVMMGTDRTSIHKPQFCLRGSGWDIDGGESALETVRMQNPHPYDLEVMKLVSAREVKLERGPTLVRGIYVYWFVADNELTAKHETRMWKTATHLLRTGELQRWSYVSCFAVCLPGQEAATYDRVKKFIVASVPQFQLAANPPVKNTGPAQTASR